MTDAAPLIARPSIAADADLDDLRRRLRATRRPAVPARDGWARGVDGAFLDALLRHWAESYDWREHEHRIRALPWVATGSAGTALRLVHRRAADPGAPVVLLLHGWPDSVLRFERLLPRLTAYHVVVPALPGFPFAAPLTTTGMSIARMAEVVAAAMDELGYQRYTASGGDVGGDVAELLAAAHPDRVSALHLTNVSPRHRFTIDPASVPPEAAAYLERAAQWARAEGGYIAEQSTRPNTLAVGLGDSPAGLAAWITEKLVGWADTTGGIDRAFSPDEILTWVTAYWLTNTIGTSFSSYVEPAKPADRVETPTVLSSFAHDILLAPRSYAELFVNVHDFVAHPAGGHFAAWEQPAAYAADLDRAVRLGQKRSAARSGQP
jgi:pimeloyl-ACP methyl ester carboxylesterase